MKHLYALSLLVLSALPVSAQTTLTTSELEAMSTRQAFVETSVHDPSVVSAKQGDATTYYIYGSHLGVSKTTDLMNWTSNIGGGESNSCTLFTNPNGEQVGYADAYSTQAVTKIKNYAGEEVDFPNFDAHAWQYKDFTVAGNQWAPDVIYNPTMQKWLMYMSLNGDNWCSSIVCFAADDIEGPWTYQGPVVMSGFNGVYQHNGFAATDDWKHTDLAIATGDTELPARYKVPTSANLGTYWPNCIDPCVFYDDDDNLWMTYGSWSGGIFILRLDKTNGLRDYTYTFPYQISGKDATPGTYNMACTSDPYFGKKIAGGAYVSGEGSYVQKIGAYYYLFMSYGFYSPDGGYEMRIFRSENPDGPYKDANQMSPIFSSYTLNYGPNAATNRGQKIIGAMNNWGTMTTGETAQGHNSAIVDEQGDAFVVFHTKFNDGTAGHQVRVRQLFVNEQGWLCASPFRYTGKQTTQSTIESQRLFTAEELAGTYQLLIHPYKLNHKNMAEATPVTVTLTADGKVTGDKTGTWSFSEDGKSFVRLTISGTIYYGMAIRQNVDGYADMPAIAFTGVSKGGVPAWMFKYEDKSRMAATYAELKSIFSKKLHEDVPETSFGATVTYACYEDAAHTIASDALSSDGKYTPTADGGMRYIVTTITSGDCTWTGDFVVSTLKEGEELAPIYYPVSTYKNLTSTWWSNFSTDNYTLTAGSSAEFHFYNYTGGLENYHNWCLYGANATHGTSDYTEYFGVRNDNWDNTSFSNTGCTSDYDWSAFLTEMNGTLVDMAVSYGTDGVFTMTSAITTTAGKVYHYSYTKTIASAPSSLVLFFVNEKSYIDGSAITGIGAVKAAAALSADDAIYNLAGQRVDADYKGIVIVGGKKIVRR